MAEPRAVLFDMDGVLVDSREPHWESWHASSARRGVTLSRAWFDSCFGRTGPDIRQTLAPDMATEDWDRWNEEKEVDYRALIRDHFPEMPGAAALARGLAAAGWRLAVASSGPPENVALLLERFTAASVFGAMVSSEDVRAGKPDPEVFLLAASRLGVPPSRCVGVEDSVPGLEALRAAGMRAVALTGTAPRESLAPLADAVLDSLAEAPPALFDKLMPA